MSKKLVHQCQCQRCQQSGNDPIKELHRQLNQFLECLDEQRRRWYVALEAKKLGHGGTKLMSQITGMHVNTIRRGRRELDNTLANAQSTRFGVQAADVNPSKKNTRSCEIPPNSS